MHFPLHMDPAHIAALALLIFVALLVWKKLPGLVAKTLDQRAETIRTELEDAQRLREEALELLAHFQKKRRDAEAEAEQIIAQAKKEAALMAEAARTDLTELLERRTQMAETKVRNAEARAEADIRAAAADAAARTAEQILANNLSAADHDRLIKNGISTLKKSLRP